MIEYEKWDNEAGIKHHEETLSCGAKLSIKPGLVTTVYIEGVEFGAIEYQHPPDGEAINWKILIHAWDIPVIRSFLDFIEKENQK